MSIDCGDPYNSPCIDGGNPNLDDYFIDCFWGLGEYRSDMGAYGGGDSTFVGIEDISETSPDNFILSQNYPNPFNAQTQIEFALPSSGHIEISVYDILGRKISTPLSKFMTAGYHSLNLNLNDHSSGLYFYTLKTTDTEIKRKMVLLK